jgi:glucose-6-phosphate dehydrogenase assembly protein OpcA
MARCAPYIHANYDKLVTDLAWSRLATSRALSSGLVDHPDMGSHVDAIDDFTAPPTQISDHSVNAGDLVDF